MVVGLDRQTKLSAEDFRLSDQKAILVATDWEPDDAMFAIGMLRALSKNESKSFPPIAFLSGGAKASVQNARAKKYVDLCKQEGFLSQNAPISFYQGI